MNSPNSFGADPPTGSPHDGGTPLIAAITPAVPSGVGRELHWAWWQQAVGDSYALTALAALTWAAIRNLLPRPARWAGAQRWQHRTTGNPTRHRPTPATTRACRPAPKPALPTPPQHHKSGRRGSPGCLEGTMTR